MPTVSRTELGGFGALYIVAAVFWLMMKAERAA
jgi:hypothetical protein